MRLVLGILLILSGFIVPSAAAEKSKGWVSIAVGEWEDNDGLHARGGVVGFYATEKEAARAAIQSCEKRAPKCSTFQSWNKGCLYLSPGYLSQGHRYKLYTAESAGEAYARCFEAGAEDCDFNKTIGGCASGEITYNEWPD